MLHPGPKLVNPLACFRTRHDGIITNISVNADQIKKGLLVLNQINLVEADYGTNPIECRNHKKFVYHRRFEWRLQCGVNNNQTREIGQDGRRTTGLSGPIGPYPGPTVCRRTPHHRLNDPGMIVDEGQFDPVTDRQRFIATTT